jgi:hypothetical protein
MAMPMAVRVSISLFISNIDFGYKDMEKIRYRDDFGRYNYDCLSFSLANSWQKPSMAQKKSVLL